MNIFFIGSSGALSLVPFKSLLSSGHSISAVGVQDPIQFDNKIIALENESLALAANHSSVPVIDMSQPVDEILNRCSDYAIDAILVSCYGKRLPENIINLASGGCYNMHPSLLPGFRGPEPIFWQMKYAVDVGVSWHRVTHDFDTGGIVAQQGIALDDGASYYEISSQLAENGAILMHQLLAGLDSGKLTMVSQDNDSASYYPYPSADDFEIDVSYSARQLYNFMTGTQAFTQPFRYQSGNQRFSLDAALDFDTKLELDTAEIQGDRLYIPCNEGVLIVSYTDKIDI
ncbi:MAG: formyltransferase family protein [Gammaproteobacteria bacterium]|nr:formyltransferase family protein [Gammaproteobacteria bacterium]